MSRRRCFSVCILCLFCWAVNACAPSSAERKEEADQFRRMGEGYLGENNVSGALSELLKAEELDKKDPYTQYALGLAYFAKDEFELAITHLKTAVALKPDYSEAMNALGVVYLRQAKWDTAIAYFEKAVSNLLYATPFKIWSNLGEAYRGKKDFIKALSYYERALNDNPRYTNAYRGIALVHMEMGDYREAVSVLEKATQYAPNVFALYMDLGTAYAVLYEKEKAIDAFKKVIELMPRSPQADRAMEEIEKLN